VTPGEELVRLERLRLANHEPMSIEESYLIHACCPGILNHDYAQEPLRETLDQEYGLRLVRARQVIRAIAASAAQARLLNVAPHAPLLFIERVSYSQHARPVEFLRIHYRADRYSLYNELHD
jgi:GntR family transcriptional regulator